MKKVEPRSRFRSGVMSVQSQAKYRGFSPKIHFYTIILPFLWNFVTISSTIRAIMVPARYITCGGIAQSGTW